MPTTHDIVQKLWSLCHTLRDDGITYHQYVTELTLLLFLKMANEVQVVIDPLATATPLDATSTLSVTCTNTTPYTVALNAGANAGGASNFGSRTMKSGSNTLAYQLYLDSGRSSVWGDGTSSSSTSAGTGTGSAQTLTIYGRLPSLANVVPGSYTDTVTVTVSY